MEVWQLRYFLAVCEELNFGRAAERLHVAQPSITRAVQALESELGVLLLMRDKRNVELTPAGRALVPEARAILGKIASSTRIAKRAAQGEVGTLVIGFEGSSALSFLPVAAAEFRQRYPEVTIDFVQMTTHDQIVALKKGEIDLGFVVPPVADADISIDIVAREELLLVMAPEHRLARQSRIAPSEVAGERIIWPAEGEACGTNRKIKEVLGDHIGGPMARISDTYLRTQFIRAGFGVTLVPASAASLMHHPLVCRPLAPAAFIQIAIALNRDSTVDVITSHFLDEVRNAARQTANSVSTAPALNANADVLS